VPSLDADGPGNCIANARQGTENYRRSAEIEAQFNRDEERNSESIPPILRQSGGRRQAAVAPPLASRLVSI